MEYKLIALDIDDTLINSARKVLPKTRAAIKAAQEKGVMVVLATGRIFAGVRGLYNDLGLTGASICGGGSQIIDASEKEIFACPIEPADTHSILARAHGLNAYAQVYINDCFVYEKHTEYSDLYGAHCGFGEMEMPDLREKTDIRTPKILMINDAEKTSEIQQIFRREYPHLNIGRSKPIFLEFTNPDATKGNALKAISRLYDIPLSAMIAVGDNEIDESMIRTAGLGAAVGNAVPSIKAVAGYVCENDNEHDAVAEVIEKFILKQDD